MFKKKKINHDKNCNYNTWETFFLITPLSSDRPLLFEIYLAKYWSFKYLSLTVYFRANFFLILLCFSFEKLLCFTIEMLRIKNMFTPTCFNFLWLRKYIILCGSGSMRLNPFFYSCRHWTSMNVLYIIIQGFLFDCLT